MRDSVYVLLGLGARCGVTRVLAIMLLGPLEEVVDDEEVVPDIVLRGNLGTFRAVDRTGDRREGFGDLGNSVRSTSIGLGVTEGIRVWTCPLKTTPQSFSSSMLIPESPFSASTGCPWVL